MSSEMLQIIGLSVDIFGVLLMSYSYFSSTKFIAVPWFLLISLFSITKADFDASFSKRLNGEKHGRAVQGLACIIIGFILQIIALTVLAPSGIVSG